MGEQEALEAASYDGGNDRGTDFFFVDDEWDRVIILQWKYYQSSRKIPGAGDITQRFNVVSELSDSQDLRDDGRGDLAEAADALAEARDRGYSIDLRFLYPGFKNKDGDREASRLIRGFNRDHQDDQITAQLVRLDDLQIAYEDYQGSADRVREGRLDLAGSAFLEEEEPFGRLTWRRFPARRLRISTKSTVIGCSIKTYVLFLGNRKGSVNAGMNQTLADSKERGNFWAYNNGITVIARGVKVENGFLELTDFSIVNGCQTTVSIAQAGPTAAKKVSVVARVIVAEDPDLVERVIRFTNSQTPISVWDISARDKLQQRLRNELEGLEEPWFYALRRGELEALADKSKFGKHGSRRILPFPLSAQYLAAFRGMPVEAYKEKALLFSVHKSGVFPADTEARDLLWAWTVGEAVQQAIPQMSATFKEDEVATAILKRGARFFVTSIAAQLLREQNGNDFVARLGSARSSLIQRRRGCSSTQR